MTNDELAEFIVAEVRGYVDTTLASAIGRLEASFADRVECAVEERINALPAPEPGPAGLPGKDGKDIDRAELDSMVQFAVNLIPRPKDGAPGKDADPEVIRAEVAKAVAALPPAAPGKNGEDGKDVELLVVKALVDGAVANAVAALPPPKDGRDGKDGITVEQLETATLKALGAALGEVHLDRRDLKIGDRLIGTIPFPLYAKVYQPETRYEKGDMVTWGGDLWHCNTATQEKPGQSDAWTLSVKKGRDLRPLDRERPVKR